MPRHARLQAPGAVVHVIVRFVNHEFRLVGPSERAAVLDRLSVALTRTDWRLHAYALMSSHMHFAFTAGLAAVGRMLKSFDGSVAKFLNKEHGRFGPVIAERPRTVVMPRHAMAPLVAYIHNNPVRAAIAATSLETDWTSHRAWVGEAAAPSWLAVDEGLLAAGFERTTEGRTAFDRFVRARGGDARDPVLSGAVIDDARAEIRAQSALPLEVGSAEVVDGMLGAGVFHCGGAPRMEPRWDGDLAALIGASARHAGCPVEQLCSRSHVRSAVYARRIEVVAGVWCLRRRVNEVAAALGITNSAASQLQRRGERVLEIAKRVAREVRARD